MKNNRCAKLLNLSVLSSSSSLPDVINYITLSLAYLWLCISRCHHTWFVFVATNSTLLRLLHFGSRCPLTSQLGPINKSHMNSEVACLLDSFGNRSSCTVKIWLPGTQGNKSNTSGSKTVKLQYFNLIPDKGAEVKSPMNQYQSRRCSAFW